MAQSKTNPYGTAQRRLEKSGFAPVQTRTQTPGEMQFNADKTYRINNAMVSGYDANNNRFSDVHSIALPISENPWLKSGLKKGQPVMFRSKSGTSSVAPFNKAGRYILQSNLNPKSRVAKFTVDSSYLTPQEEKAQKEKFLADIKSGDFYKPASDVMRRKEYEQLIKPQAGSGALTDEIRKGIFGQDISTKEYAPGQEPNFKSTMYEQKLAAQKQKDLADKARRQKTANIANAGMDAVNKAANIAKLINLFTR